jgi:hypothetical protein
MRLFVVDERVLVWVIRLPNRRPLDVNAPESGAAFRIPDRSRDASRIEEAAKQPARRDKSAMGRVSRYAEHGEGHGEELDVYQHLQCGNRMSPETTLEHGSCVFVRYITVLTVLRSTDWIRVARSKQRAVARHGGGYRPNQPSSVDSRGPIVGPAFDISSAFSV